MAKFFQKKRIPLIADVKLSYKPNFHFDQNMTIWDSFLKFENKP